MDSALRIMSGRLFQAVGPANAKARLPNSRRVRGTMRWPLDAERSDDLAVDNETGTHIDTGILQHRKRNKNKHTGAWWRGRTAQFQPESAVHESRP